MSMVLVPYSDPDATGAGDRSASETPFWTTPRPFPIHQPAPPIGARATAQEAQVAQLVEQRTENPRVGSSILSLGTILFNGLSGSVE